ncbi:MAG: hypothetical protein PHN72_05940 [Bacilli bacterium]|nr:hypothetical protein [Bacilli bacterium]
MENKSKHKWVNRIFRYLFVLSFIAFLTLYLSQATGYYEYENHQKNALTEEQIKEFEKDVKSGKNIKIEDYMEKTVTDYSNKTSKMGNKVSETINHGVKSGIETFFGALNKLIEG